MDELPLSTGMDANGEKTGNCFGTDRVDEEVDRALRRRVSSSARRPVVGSARRYNSTLIACMEKLERSGTAFGSDTERRRFRGRSMPLTKHGLETRGWR